MTEREQHWERLVKLIKWYEATTNHFAMQVGMLRSENLYHIKDGESGITADFANRIVSFFPEINRTWLLTGVGSMLISESNKGINIPFYDGEICEILPTLSQIAPSGHANLPFANRCDFIARTHGLGCNGGDTQLFFRYADHMHMEEGCEYALLLYSGVVYGRVQYVDDERITMLSYSDNKEETFAITDIKQAWLVIAKMELQGCF